MGISALLNNEQIRRTNRDSKSWYAATDVVAVLTDSQHPDEYWDDLKRRDAHIAGEVEMVALQEKAEPIEALDLTGVLRLVQAIDSPKSDRIKLWMADAAAARLEEAHDPELAIMRARRLYEQQGYSRQWVDSRMSTVSARQDLASEWYRRGARESDQFRALTNELIRTAFGMDVEGYRQFKHLRGTSENLRDHMTDLELALTRLAEMTAAALHRDRNSQSFDQLLHDVHDAGEITAKTRSEIESRRGKPVSYPGSFAA